MSERSPILGYVSSHSFLDELEGAYVIRLQRPAAWPQIIVVTIGIFGIGTFALAIIIAAGAKLRVATNWQEATRTILLATLILVIPAALIRHLCRELNSLRIAGTSPLTLAIHDGKLLIDDRAAFGESIRSIDPRGLKSVKVHSIGTSLSMQLVRELRLTRGWTDQIQLRFVQPDSVAAKALEIDLRERLGLPPSPE